MGLFLPNFNCAPTVTPMKLLFTLISRTPSEFISADTIASFTNLIKATRDAVSGELLSIPQRTDSNFESMLEASINCFRADVVAQMHMAKITMKRLAAECGYTPEYVSMVLNGHRDTEIAKATILAALGRLVNPTGA